MAKCGGRDSAALFGCQGRTMNAIRRSDRVANNVAKSGPGYRLLCTRTERSLCLYKTVWMIERGVELLSHASGTVG